MTAQFSEDLMYEDKVLSMKTEPLAPLLDALPEPLQFEECCTACWLFAMMPTSSMRSSVAGLAGKLG